MEKSYETTQRRYKKPATVYIHTTSLVLITVLSLVGNSLVCLAFYRNRRLRQATNFHVLSLSVSGLIMATLEFPFLASASGLRKWLFSTSLCQFNGFITYPIAGVSLSTLSLTAINRYIRVVKPQRYPVLFTKKKTVLENSASRIVQLGWSITFLDLNI